MNKNDEYFMSIALNLAYRAIGNVAPNPAVGCIIVRDNHIISRGWTQPSGRPHAESVAINNAKEDISGTTMYVTLEPCSHFGQTMPCVDLIIKSRIKKVIISIQDPDQRVNGRGIETLQAHRIQVEYGICKTKAKQLNIGYFSAKSFKRPYITVKIATTLDGKIAIKNGNSKWITNKLARDFAHKLRAQNDGIMIGSNTLTMDDPSLDCRLSGLEIYSPIKIIADNKNRLKHSHAILKNKNVLTFTKANSVHTLHKTIQCRTIQNGNINLIYAAQHIADHGITRLLVEGGGKLISSLLKDNLVDQIIWMRSSTIAGNDAIPAIHDLDIQQIPELYKFQLIKSNSLNDTQIDVFQKHHTI